MATNIEMDLMLKRAIRLLHSQSTNSATDLRQMLDEVIKQRFGTEKMLCKTLNKKQLEEEKNFPGRIPTPPPQEDEIINLSSPAKPNDSPDTMVDSDDGTNSNSTRIGATVPPLLTAADEDVNLKEFGDLNCCECGEMMFTASNRLIECSKCGALYHQECHKPAISDEDASEDREQSWLCHNCDKANSRKTSCSKSADVVFISDEAVTPIKNVNKNKSTSSSSSNSSSPFHKNEQVSSKQKAHRDDHRTCSKNNNSANVVTPSINVVSAPDRNSTHSKRYHSQNSTLNKPSRTRYGESSQSKKRSSK